MLCLDGALTKVSVMLQKGTSLILSSFHNNWDESSGLKYSEVFSIQKNGWKVSAPALNISILKIGKPVKTEV